MGKLFGRKKNRTDHEPKILTGWDGNPPGMSSGIHIVYRLPTGLCGSICHEFKYIFYNELSDLKQTEIGLCDVCDDLEWAKLN